MIDALYIGPLPEGELVGDLVEAVDVVDEDDVRVVDEVVDLLDTMRLGVVVLVEVTNKHCE